MALATLRGVRAHDERLGQLLRLIRRRAGLTQEELAAAAGVPVRDVALVEAGEAGSVLVHRVRRIFAAAGGQARLTAWWNGAAADRLLDERHADVLERASRVMAALSWEVPTEVSYNEFGERGSVDLFGQRRDLLAVAIGEVKSAFGSLEELNRAHDAKVRLAPKLCRERFGWTPRHVGRLLIVPDESSIRRIVAAHRQTLDGVYPARSREIRAWLRHPDRNIGGIWFLSDPRIRRTDSAEDR